MQSCEAENRARIVSYFESGARSCCQRQKASTGVLGVEIEHFIVYDDGAPMTYAERSAENRIGVRDVLQFLTTYYPHAIISETGALIGCYNDEANITLEPAAQLEVSIAPFASIKRIGQVYQNFRACIDSFLNTYGAKLVAKGYHPTRLALEMPLIPKTRYHFMDGYFASLGTHGERMMRASASTQVSIDYYSEADAVRKLRIASALAPILGVIANNTQLFEQRPARPVSRLTMWRDVDNDRCGVIPGVFSSGFGFESYAQWLLQMPPIFITRTPKPPVRELINEKQFVPRSSNAHLDGQRVDKQENAEGVWFTGSLSAAQAYSDAPMETNDIEHVISMHWPDVRLKRYIEIRCADSLPYEQMMAYAALIKGIFYSEKALCAIEEELGVTKSGTSVKNDIWVITEADVDNAIEAIASQGSVAEVYGTSLTTWKAMLFTLAEESLGSSEAAYLAAFGG